MSLAETRADELTKALDAVAQEPRITAALRLAEDLRAIAAFGTHPGDDAALLEEAIAAGDDLTSLAAIHAIGAVADGRADEALLRVVLAGEEPFAAHAAWAFGARGSSPAACDAIDALRIEGGFAGMLAERTLAEWDRASRAGQPPAPDPAQGSAGVTVIQPYLHARLDRDGTALGAGDAGGIASLLRSLGTALARQPGIDEVITVTRRHPGDSQRDVLGAGHRIERVEVGPPGRLPWREAWIHRAEVEERFLLLGRSLADRHVVWHLRMAEVGTLAAAAAARRLGQPVVFTAAPDPHVVIDALQEGGKLRRSTFAVEDGAAQFWFRARMVERLTAHADRLVLMPRADVARDLVNLVGLDADDVGGRAIVVPEGVDVDAIDAAADRVAAGTLSPRLQSLIGTIAEDRRHLPWLLTVGRLHPAKGMHRLVEAVAGDPELVASFNIVIVGGDIESPSPDERSTIEKIHRAALGADPGLVTLAGHMPPSVVAEALAYLSANDGVYVCASDKEEFGLAIVEALAAGVCVVGPQRGGVSTYLTDDLGVLCDTLRVEAIREAIVTARTKVTSPGRARRARQFVRANLSIDGMAESLAGVYLSLVPVGSSR